MKTFQFRLARILHIRIAQERSEQQKLDQLQAIRNQVEAEITALDQSLVRAQQQLRAEASLVAAQLTQLHSYEQGAERLREGLLRRLSEQEQLLRAQTGLVVIARRDVKLLEKLQEKQRSEWQAEADRENEALAGDLAAAQWIRSNPRPR